MAAFTNHIIPNTKYEMMMAAVIWWGQKKPLKKPNYLILCRKSTWNGWTSFNITALVIKYTMLTVFYWMSQQHNPMIEKHAMTTKLATMAVAHWNVSQKFYERMHAYCVQCTYTIVIQNLKMESMQRTNKNNCISIEIRKSQLKHLRVKK